MSVGDAINLWWQYIEPVNADFKVSPAVTASPNGIKWIQNFVDGCNGCNVRPPFPPPLPYLTLHIVRGRRLPLLRHGRRRLHLHRRELPQDVPRKGDLGNGMGVPELRRCQRSMLPQRHQGLPLEDSEIHERAILDREIRVVRPAHSVPWWLQYVEQVDHQWGCYD